MLITLSPGKMLTVVAAIEVGNNSGSVYISAKSLPGCSLKHNTATKYYINTSGFFYFKKMDFAGHSNTLNILDQYYL